MKLVEVTPPPSSTDTNGKGVHGANDKNAANNNGIDSNRNGDRHSCCSEVHVFNYGRLNSNIVLFVPKSHFKNSAPLGIRKFILFIKRVCMYLCSMMFIGGGGGGGGV